MEGIAFEYHTVRFASCLFRQVLVEDDEIRERAPDVNRQSNAHRTSYGMIVSGAPVPGASYR